MYGEGVSYVGCIVDLGVEYDVVNKSGAWYSYGEMRLGQGREKAKEYLKDNLVIAREIEEKVRKITLSNGTQSLSELPEVNANEENSGDK